MNGKFLGVALSTSLLALSASAQAQQPGKPARLGYLDAGTAAGSAEYLEAFRKQMTELNWIEGKNFTIEYRYSAAKPDRDFDLAVELVRLKPDLIVVNNTNTALAVQKATSTIPVVMTTSIDPVAQGLIGSMARPGGNITGLANFSDELPGKRIEILREVLPKATRIGIITGSRPGSGGRGTQVQLKVMNDTASALGLKLIEIGSAIETEKLVTTFQTAVRERVNAITTVAGPGIFAQRKSIVVLAANHKLPAIYPFKEFVEDGGLMSYGPDFRDQYRRAAIYVDKILKGAKPADLPVERSAKFEFYASLKAAKQIDLVIPPNVLARADRVIK